MTVRTNLAIIGYGYMGRVYKKACLELYERDNIESYYKFNLPLLLKGFKLKAIVDTRFQSSNYNENEGIWYFDSLEKLLEHSELEIDAAVVATPIPTHYDIAKELVIRKISLLIEKPVCETAEKIKKLMKLSKKYHTRIMPGHVERYNPVTLEAAETVKFKVYGKVRSYRLLRESFRPQRVKESLIIDKLIHDLDLAYCIIGKFTITDIRVKRIDGEIMKCTLSTLHRKGIKGEIVSSWLSKDKRRSMSIEFERSFFEGDLVNKVVTVARYKELVKQISGYKNNQIKDQLVDFIAYANKYTKTLVTMKDALASAYLIDEIERRIGQDV